MKCNGSQTTSTAAEGTSAAGGSKCARAAADGDTEVAAFQALLMSSLMKPLSDALGPMGSLVLDSVARTAILKPATPHDDE
jgi:hypothetical protein